MDYKYCNDIDDFKLFFCNDEESQVYVHSTLNNLMDVLNNLSISKQSLTYKNDINEEMHKAIVQLAYSVLEARFNNKVEISPVDELIPKYEGKFSDPNDWIDPTDREFMALCSASPCTLTRACKFRNGSFLKSSILKDKEEDDDKNCSPLKATGNYCYEFGSDDDDYNKPPLILEPIYKQIVDDALNLSENRYL